MNNKIAILASILMLSLFSCKEDIDIWDSQVVDLAGDWYVSYDHSVYGPDAFGVGLTAIHTFNTAADDGTEMWLTDDAHFWDYKVKVPVDLGTLTFGTTDTLVSVVTGYEIKVIVNNGKIIQEAALLPSGVMADSIHYEIWFEDLEGATGIASDTLFVSGYRKTGFKEDEPH